ncbi:MAG: hypothetical protein IKO52_01100, partial [Clostridia bacterium]|nr:hypothetical protein [Clostridia bacterium]
LLIQGTQEFTQPTFSGAMAVMEDEKEALRDFFARNDLFHAEQAPDYASAFEQSELASILSDACVI